MQTDGKEPHEVIADVRSMGDFAQFVSMLRDDFIKNEEGWENPTMDRFLDAMQAWVISMDAYHRKTGEGIAVEPTWQGFAQTLHASTMYE